MQMNLFGLHCRGVNSINDEVKYTQVKYTQKPRAMQMNLFGLHCRGVNSINDEVKYTQILLKNTTGGK